MAPRYEKRMNNELNKFLGFDYGEFVSWLIDETNQNRRAFWNYFTDLRWVPIGVGWIS
jgi:hypothetical protein